MIGNRLGYTRWQINDYSTNARPLARANPTDILLCMYP